ncbi:hypothetical protein [Kitasatospora acidiphila]|nr:hypothetical protein [Kitasatospora acidiphila]
MIKLLVAKIKKARTFSLSDRGNQQLRTVVLLAQFAAVARELFTTHNG